MSREIEWRWPTAEEAAAMFQDAIARGRATRAEFAELMALPTDGTPKQTKRIHELLDKFDIRKVPADPVRDGLIQIWPPPPEEERLWEETRRETVNGVTTIDLKFIGPTRRRRSRKQSTSGKDLTNAAPTREKRAMTNQKPELPPVAPMATGRYRHYKGKEYEVIGVARHSETLEELVVYQALYGDHGLWVRPRLMFTESVDVDGKRVPRFEYVGMNQ